MHRFLICGVRIDNEMVPCVKQHLQQLQTPMLYKTYQLLILIRVNRALLHIHIEETDTYGNPISTVAHVSNRNMQCATEYNILQTLTLVLSVLFHESKYTLYELSHKYHFKERHSNKHT